MDISVELVDHMGNDLTVVNSARVSFSKESQLDEDGHVTDPDERLIRYLANHNHFTPFTHPQITLRETIPIFVARQRFKHTVGFSYNEVSRRYVDDTPEFFVPGAWRERPTGGLKQGSAGIHPDTNHINKEYLAYINSCAKYYEALIAQNVAPEQARMVLPQSMMTSYYVTGSLAAFARAYKLRQDKHAQQEIRDLAKQWDKIIRPLFPSSWAALTPIWE